MSIVDPGEGQGFYYSASSREIAQREVAKREVALGISLFLPMLTSFTFYISLKLKISLENKMRKLSLLLCHIGLLSILFSLSFNKFLLWFLLYLLNI
jgi:hypothetical protein